MSLHRAISKTHPPTALPKSRAAAASCRRGLLQGPKTRQNPASCSAQLPRTPMPSLQPVGHNAYHQNTRSSLLPTLTHPPSSILRPGTPLPRLLQAHGKLWGAVQARFSSKPLWTQQVPWQTPPIRGEQG